MAVVFGDLSRDAERFRLTLAEEITVVDTMQGLMAAVESDPDEDLVIVGSDAPLSVATEMAERYRLDRPALGVICMRRRLELQVMSEAMRAGVREVVPADDAEALLHACTRSLSVSRQLRRLEARPDDTGRGRIILVFGAKGGCGKTTLATNLSAALALAESGRVCLVDLNLEFGDVSIAMQADPTRTIGDALGMQGGLDRDGLAGMVTAHSRNLDLLLAPRRPGDAEFISADLVGQVVRLLAEMYDFVVIDSPPALNDAVLACFDVADSYVLLTTLDMLALRNFKATLDTLDALGYPRERWRIVLNRCDAHVGLAPEDIESVIGMEIDVRLPSSKEVPASINRGVPIVVGSPRHPFSAAVAGLARSEIRSAHGVSAAQTTRRGFLSRAARR
jgi:pilus assembly protein CpaE